VAESCLYRSTGSSGTGSPARRSRPESRLNGIALRSDKQTVSILSFINVLHLRGQCFSQAVAVSNRRYVAYLFTCTSDCGWTFQFGKLPPHWNLRFRVSSTDTPQPPSGKCTRLSGLAISPIAPSPRKTASTTSSLRSRPTPRGGPAWKKASPRGWKSGGARYRGHAGQEVEWPRLERSLLAVEPCWPPGSLVAHLRQDQLSRTTLGLRGRRYRRRVGTVTGGRAA
jgi:hypothetical protein